MKFAVSFVMCAFLPLPCLAQPVVQVQGTSYNSYAFVTGGGTVTSNTATSASVIHANGAATGHTKHTLTIPGQNQAVCESNSTSGGWPNNQWISAFSDGHQDVTFQVAMPNQTFSWESFLDTNNEAVMQNPEVMGSIQIQDGFGNVWGLRTIADKQVNPATQNLEWFVQVEIWGGAWQPLATFWKTSTDAQNGTSLVQTPLTRNFAVNDLVRTASSSELLNANGPFQFWNPASVHIESIFKVP